ncbi:MAG: amidohydrolase family protein, partial [Promethearchaeota archaeon]
MKLFHNAKIFTDDKLISGYLTIENGKIKDISSDLPTQQIQDGASEAIDCHGNYIFPGFIDAHVHFRDAEQNYKESIETGSKGALAGGVTSVITMPNTIPPLSTVENLDSYKNLAKSEKLFTNVGFFSGVKTGFKISTVSALSKAGIFGIKVYPGDSPESLPLEWLGGWKQDLIPEEFIAKIDKICSNFKVDELYENWRDLFKIAKNFNLPVLFHPEVPRETAQYEKIWDDGIKIAEIEQVPNPNLYAHSVQHGMYSNELALVEMIISFIRKFYPEPKDAPHVHFVHLSSPEPIEIIEKLLKDSGYPCSIEVTPHHLFLNYDSKFTQEVFGKVLVPLRSPKM